MNQLYLYVMPAPDYEGDYYDEARFEVALTTLNKSEFIKYVRKYGLKRNPKFQSLFVSDLVLNAMRGVEDANLGMWDTHSGEYNIEIYKNLGIQIIDLSGIQIDEILDNDDIKWIEKEIKKQKSLDQKEARARRFVGISQDRADELKTILGPKWKELGTGLNNIN